MGYAEQAAAAEESAKAIERIQRARAYLLSKRGPGTPVDVLDIVREVLALLDGAAPCTSDSDVLERVCADPERMGGA